MAEEKYNEQEIFYCFREAAKAVNAFCFIDGSIAGNFKVLKQNLHLLSVIADDQIEHKLKDKTQATKNHMAAITYLKRELPEDDQDIIAEYRETADAIIRTYSKLINEAFL